MHAGIATLSLKKLNSKTTKKRITAVVALLSILVISGVFWWLRYEGITMADEAFCGLDEHTHTDECLANNCTLTEHTHTVLCYSNVAADVETPSVWEETLNKTAFTGDVAKDMVTVATSQLGYTESLRNFDIDDNGTRCGYTRYGEWYGNKYGHWSAMFVSFCLNYANVTEDSALINSGAAAMLTAWQDAELLTANPIAGDIVFLDTKGNGSCSEVGVVISVGNNISVIQGNSNDKVEKLTYSADDEKIIGYGSVYLALEQSLTEKETSRVEFVRNLANEMPTEDEVVDKMVELGTGTEFDAWKKELVQQIKTAYYYYDLLPARLAPLVYNSDKILDLNYIRQSDMLDGEENSDATSELVIPVHQINEYYTYNSYAYPETYNGLFTKKVGDAEADFKFSWWDAYIIEKDPQGFYFVADIDRKQSDFADRRQLEAQTDGGFVYLIWVSNPFFSQTKNIEVGNIVEVNPEAMLTTDIAASEIQLGELTFILGSDRSVEKDVFALGNKNIALGKLYNTSLLFDESYAYPDKSGVRYPDEGGVTLTDGIIVTSESDINVDDWMGFHVECPDFEETGVFVTNVDLEKTYDVGKVTLSFANKSDWGIALPDAVTFYGSLDGNTYEPIGTVTPVSDGSKYYVEVSLRCNVKARYIKAEITPNSDGSAWVFVSEFEAYEALKAPTVIESADTFNLIDVNLYDYGNNINDWYAMYDEDNPLTGIPSPYYPGFSQGGGPKNTYASLNLNQFNYGDSIHLNRESGEYGVTGNGNSYPDNTGKINQSSDREAANLPVEGAMYHSLVDGFPAALNAAGNPLSLAYLFDNMEYDPDGDGKSEIYSVKQNDKNINGLFQYDESTGMYYFDSRKNFAQFDADSDIFTLYEQIITPNFIMYPFGNFLPFNNIETQATQMSQINRDWFIRMAKNALYRSNLIEASKSNNVFTWDGLSFHDNIYLSGRPNEDNIGVLGFTSFGVDYVNPNTAEVSIGEKCWLITGSVAANTPASYSSYATAVLLQPTAVAGVYEVVDRVTGNGTAESVTFSTTPTTDMIILMAHTAYTGSGEMPAQRRQALNDMYAGHKVSFTGMIITTSTDDDNNVTTTVTLDNITHFYTANGTSDLVIEEACKLENKNLNDYLDMAFAIRSMIKNVDAYVGSTDWTYSDLVKRYFASIDDSLADTTLFENFVFPAEDAEKIFCVDYDEPKNFFFGMDMTLEFIQPKDGLTGPNGDTTMIYRFSGDDDVWIYLDDILFLDLSGIHRHVGGTIDFTNGIVTYNKLMPETGDVDYDTPVDGMTKTFRQILSEAGYSDAEIDKMLSPKGGFADYSEHTLKFYYMERGSGSGVCRMEFNVPVIESNRIMVSKEVDDEETGVIGNPDYYFQILHEDNTTLYFEEGTEFTIISDSNPTGRSAVVGENGIFAIKAGETAIFSALESAGKYVVRELFAEDVYKQYGEVKITVNGEPVNNQYIDVADTITVDGILDDTGWKDSDWITVSPDMGIYQHPEKDTETNIRNFRYQVRKDGNKAYFAVEYLNTPTTVSDELNTGNDEGTNIRLWVHDGETESTTYTSFYDIFFKATQGTGCSAWTNSVLNGSAKVENTGSSLAAASTVVGTSWIVEFSVDLTEVGGEDKDFKFFFNMTDIFTVDDTTVTKVLLYPSAATFPYATFVTGNALDITDTYYAMGTHPELSTGTFEFLSTTIGGVNYKYAQSTTIDISDGYATVDFTNVVDTTKLGELIIEKKLTDDITNNQDVEFTLNVKLDGEPIPVGTSYLYIDPNGTATTLPVINEGLIPIKPGYRVKLINALIGTTYTVSEVGALEMGYDVHYHHGSVEEGPAMAEHSEAEIMIDELGATCLLIVHNVKDGEKVVVYGEKTLGNTNGADNVYNFTLTQVDESLNPILDGVVMTSSVTIAEGTEPFNFVISYPAETTEAGTYYYLIEEDGANALTGMDTTQYLLTVVITFDVENGMEAESTLEKIGAEGTVETASFYNNIYQALTVNKEILGFYDGGAFEFTINATRSGSMIIGDYPCINPDGSHGYITFTASKATVHLNDNQSITVYLPYGTAWTVTETSVAGCDTRVGLTEDTLKSGTSLSGMLTEDRTVYFVNVFGDELPSTGSNVRLIITYCGIGLMAIAFIGACVFRISRKRRSRK